tara:strand:- start:4 stop:186 length:183 start_codon:yes stop_codon:yes gene_type:complete
MSESSNPKISVTTHEQTNIKPQLKTEDTKLTNNETNTQNIPPRPPILVRSFATDPLPFSI